MLTCNQIRMSRAALGWSISKLSERSSVSVSTIKRLESEDGFNKATEANLRLIRETLPQAPFLPMRFQIKAVLLLAIVNVLKDQEVV